MDHARHAPPAASAAPPRAPPAGTTYTCPMHPQIRRAAPGSCPICGMALEPVLPAEDEDNDELRAMTRRFWWALALSLPLLAMAMPEALPFDASAWVDRTAAALGLPHRLGVTWAQWLQAALATPVVWWAGWPLLQRGARSFATGRLNMFSLIGG